MAKISKGQAAEVQGDSRPTSPVGVYIHDQSESVVETVRGQRGSIQGDALVRMGYRLATEQEVSDYRKSKKENLEDNKLEIEKEREAEARQLRADATQAQKEAEEAQQRAKIASQGANNLAAEAESANSEESKSDSNSSKKSSEKEEGGNK